MAKKSAGVTDWMPPSRQGQLDMAKTWISVMTETTKGPGNTEIPKWTAWEISETTFIEFGELFAAAQAALAAANKAETRTEVVTATCERTFDALKAAMRDLKKRKFYMPPLTVEDIVALGLKNPDHTATDHGPADAIIELTIYHRALRELGIRYAIVSGNPDNPANYIRIVAYKVAAAGEPAPTRPEELGEPFITQRKQDTLRFDFGSSGSTVYIAARAGKGDKKGAWGPMISAVIP